MNENKSAPNGVHALLLTGDGLLILQEKSFDYKLFPENSGKITMFGGACEEGEAPLACLKRELREELGLDIKNHPFKKLNTYQKTTQLDGVESKVHVYIINDVDPRECTNNESDEAEASAGVCIDHPHSLLKDERLTRITRLAIQEFVKI